MDWYLAQLATGGYPLIVLLMAIESSFLPLPSELVIPPAAALTSRSGELSTTGIVLAGTLGSWLGATVMYWGARWLGRPLVLRYGRYVMIAEDKVHAAERWAAQYGAGGVFFSRLLPVIRHLIGIPMGIVEMNFWRYSLFTVLGSALWCTVLTVVGVKAGQDEALMQGDLHRITLWLITGVAVLGTLYYFMVHRTMSKPKES
ncbi:MAG: DedA family protein [Nevskiaceae bacterium]|nr:MAG: DedA family protein [Nevskiaceae bacterium]